jgi:hypothetical protein
MLNEDRGAFHGCDPDEIPATPGHLAIVSPMRSAYMQRFGVPILGYPSFKAPTQAKPSKLRDAPVWAQGRYVPRWAEIIDRAACSPLTGRYASAALSWARAARDKGYAAKIVVSYHLGGLEAVAPLILRRRW